jgi:tetratricopeptide (TPR) repeat protein
LGVILFQSGNVREAISQWQISLEISPNDGNAQNNLAWVLATYPDEGIRRGDKAVELAEKAARLPGGENPIVLRTLAAAYAEDGRFAKAIDTGERSRELANTWRNPSLAKALEMDIALYQRNRPLRDNASKNSPP